jgi:hypothetical protein
MTPSQRYDAGAFFNHPVRDRHRQVVGEYITPDNICGKSGGAAIGGKKSTVFFRGSLEEAGCVCAGIKRLSALDFDNAIDQKAPSLFRRCIFWHGIMGYSTVVVASLFAMHEKSVKL